MHSQFGKISYSAGLSSTVSNNRSFRMKGAFNVEAYKKSKDESSSNATNYIDAKDARAEKFYKNAILYPRKFVNRDLNLHTEKEISYIKIELGFERSYPKKRTTNKVRL